MRYIRNYTTRGIGVYYVDRIFGGPTRFGAPGWIACTKDVEKGYFDTKVEAEMGLLEMMLE